MRFIKILIFGLFITAFTSDACFAGFSATKIGLNVKEFRLKNGMLFLVVERPAVPHVACRVAIRAGSALEDTGKTGIAHLLEHMMFKGTKNFGTLDIKRDRELQGRIEAAYQAVLSEERKRNPDKEIIRERLREMDRLRTGVQKIYIPQAFSIQAESNGAINVNAFTSKDQTQYLMSVPSDMLEQWASLVSEQLFEPSWREFYVEKEVVRREWASRYINNPGGAAWLDLDSTAYTAHPYRNPTIGWLSDMKNFNTRDAIAFHKKYYNPANAVCVLAGDVTVEEAKKLAKIYFERYPQGIRAPEKVTEEPVQKGPRKSVRFLKGARTPLIRIGFHSAPMRSRDFFALDAMTMILSSGRSARMTQNIIDKGLAVQAWAYNPDNRYGGMVVLGGSPVEPDALKGNDLSAEEKHRIYLKACEKLEDILLREVDKLKKELVSTRELERIKKLNQRDFLGRMRSNRSLAGSLATLEILTGWRYLSDYLEKMAEIKPEDIRRVAKTYIRRDNKTSVYVIPGGMSGQPADNYSEVRSADGAAFNRPVQPENLINNSIYPTPEDWKHPLSFKRRPEKIFYPEAETVEVQGATVFYLPDHELPLIDLTILVKAGNVDISEDKAGLTRLLNGSIIRGGTKKYPPRELAMALDEKAIRLSVSVRGEDTVIRLSVMKDSWEKGLALMEEVVLRPRFDPDVLDVVKERILTSLRRQGGNAGAICRREGMIWHFKGHPYGRDPLKMLKTVPKLIREDLQGFLRTYFIPSNMVVAVAGDIEKAEVVKGLEKFFLSFPSGRAPSRELQDPPETPPVLALIHKPGQVQSKVRMFLEGVKRTDPAYWNVRLLMNIMGGSNSLMFTRLRDDLGLVYGAGFFQTYKWRAGLLAGYIGCKGDKTARAIAETMKIMNSLRVDVPENVFERKKLDELNSFVFNIDTPVGLVNAYSGYHMRGEPMDTPERIQDSFMNATREDLRALAKRFLNKEKLQIFVVADKTIRIKKSDGSEVSLEDALKSLAEKSGLPFREIELR